jgi:hypothetical protein
MSIAGSLTATSKKSTTRWRVWFLTTPLGHFDERRWRWVPPDDME